MAENTAPDPVDIVVGHRTRVLRKLKGLSQQVLGEKIGVTFQQVQKYERGANRISVSMLVRISKALGVPVSEMFPPEMSGHPVEPPAITAAYTILAKGGEDMLIQLSKLPGWSLGLVKHTINELADR